MRKIILLTYMPVYLVIFWIAIIKDGSINNFVEIITTQNIQEAIIVSLIYCTSVAFINLFMGAWVGASLSRCFGKVAHFFDLLVIFPLIVPNILVITGLHIFMIKLGLVDNLLSVILINLLPTLPYSIKICKNAYSDIGTKYFEKAKLLGASKFQSFIFINVHLLKETYEYVFLLSFVIAVSQYAITAIIGGGVIVGLSMVYFPFFATSNDSFIASFCLLFMILPFAVMLVFKTVYSYSLLK